MAQVRELETAQEMERARVSYFPASPFHGSEFRSLSPRSEGSSSLSGESTAPALQHSRTAMLDCGPPSRRGNIVVRRRSAMLDGDEVEASLSICKTRTAMPWEASEFESEQQNDSAVRSPFTRMLGGLFPRLVASSRSH